MVKLSGLGAGPEAPITLPRAHHESETHILDSGLVSTFVRPNLFFQTLLGAAESIAKDGAIYAPAGDGAISFTDARDVADVIVTAATSIDDENRVFEITGPRAWRYAEVAEVMARLVGRDVRHVDLTPEQQREFLTGLGVDGWTTEAFVELFGIYRAGYGSAVLSSPIEQVTGRPAKNLETFLDDDAEIFRKAAV